MPKASDTNKGYASFEADNLRTDLRTHSKEKSNRCNRCNYTYFYEIDLKKHLKRHSGEKSSKCSQCDYVSFNAGNLRTHLKTHIGEKSFFLISLEAHQTYSVNLKTIAGQD